MRKARGVIVFLSLALAGWAEDVHPILALGSPAPNFELPGVDGQVHKLSDYAASPTLVVVFTCNHCPIAQMYETRIQKLADDYRDRGVALVAIQPNAPEAIRIDELDSSDMSDSLDEMKLRAQYKHLHYPYLYDGATQSVARAYGPQATPHVFVFDRERHLRYEGRMDNSYRAELVKSQDARNAIDALLAHKDVAVKHTGAFGCSTKWKEKEASRLETLRKIESQPVPLEMASADILKKLRSNPTGKTLLVSFWATWCGTCIDEFPDLEDTYRMYSVRDLELVTVSANMPDERSSVQRFLEKMHATSRNLLFDSDDTAALQAAFDPKWESAVPYTVLIAPNGRVLYQRQGTIDILDLRRTILANLPSDYIGFNQYWAIKLEPTGRRERSVGRQAKSQAVNARRDVSRREGMATDIWVRFGKRVRQLCTERGWNQIDSAVHTGLGRVFISDLERGKKEPCCESIEILAMAFEMTIPQLFRSL